MLHFIVNPVASFGKGKRQWENKIEPILLKKNIPYTVDFSKKRGDVTEICKKLSSSSASEKDCIIVILGGDGSLNDAVQGIEDFKNTSLALIPTGSGNDFSHAMRISRSVKKCLKKILSQKQAIEMDLGEAISGEHRKRFIAFSGIGFDGAVNYEAMHSSLKKKLNKIGLGSLTYLLIAIKEIIHAVKPVCTVELDNSGEKTTLPGFLFGTAMIHRYEGGGFMFCPKANPFDGKLSLCTVSGKSTLGVLFALPSAFFGLHGIFSGIKFFECTEVKFSVEEPLWFHTDGEICAQVTEVTLKTFDKKLRFIGA